LLEDPNTVSLGTAPGHENKPTTQPELISPIEKSSAPNSRQSFPLRPRQKLKALDPISMNCWEDDKRFKDFLADAHKAKQKSKTMVNKLM